jgi:Zn-dependent peptidase ImmA (M78 family)
MSIQAEPAKRQLHSQDAELRVLDDGRLIIEYNPHKPQVRQNFSISHEVAHTFFPDFREQIQTRQIRSRKYFDPNDQLEMLCDTGAAEILMPFPEFIMDLQDSGTGVDSLECLHMLYKSSLTATAIRMVRTDLYPCAVVLLDYSLKPAELKELERDAAQADLFPGLKRADPVPNLRVQFTIPSNSFPHFIPRDKSVDEDTPIYRASQDCCIM